MQDQEDLTNKQWCTLAKAVSVRQPKKGRMIMKKIHTYHIKFYTTGGFLKDVTVTASTKADAIAQVRKDYTVIEIYCVRFID